MIESFTGWQLLSILIFLPAVGAGLVALAPGKWQGAMRVIALSVTVVNFLLSLPLYFSFDSVTTAFQFSENYEWIPAVGAGYHLGIDGLSLLMVLLTTFLSPLVILSSWNDIRRNLKGYLISMLLLETGMVGVFCALDLLLFYVFWEAMLIPMYFIIGVWGGARRIYATLKFFIYTMSGSLLMLVAILFIYFYSGGATFDLLEIGNQVFPRQYQLWLFAAFGLSFAIKVPMFPFHTWLPDAHVEAPTAGSVILAGVLLKMGTYGFLRFCLPLFPNAAKEFAPLICILSLIGIIYGAWVAMVQPDIKKLVAYSSVSHLGFVMLGIFTFNLQGIEGAIYQMVNHGLSTGALFLIVGMIYERRHTRMIADFGGLWKQMPVFSAVFLAVTFSSIGLPGLNGFVGEFLILVGAFHAVPGSAVLAATGVVLGAVYMLWMFRRVVFGPLSRPENQQLQDLSLREVIVIAPIVGLIVFMGIYPQPFLSRMKSSTELVIQRVESQTLATPVIESEPRREEQAPQGEEQSPEPEEPTPDGK